MDREAWLAIVHGVAGVGHNLVTEQQQQIKISLICFADKIYINFNIQAIQSILRSTLQEDRLLCPHPQDALFIFLKVKSQNLCKSEEIINGELLQNVVLHHRVHTNDALEECAWSMVRGSCSPAGWPHLPHCTSGPFLLFTVWSGHHSWRVGLWKGICHFTGFLACGVTRNIY